MLWRVVVGVSIIATVSAGVIEVSGYVASRPHVVVDLTLPLNVSSFFVDETGRRVPGGLPMVQLLAIRIDNRSATDMSIDGVSIRDAQTGEWDEAVFGSATPAELDHPGDAGATLNESFVVPGNQSRYLLTYSIGDDETCWRNEVRCRPLRIGLADGSSLTLERTADSCDRRNECANLVTLALSFTHSPSAMLRVCTDLAARPDVRSILGPKPLRCPGDGIPPLVAG